MSTKNTINRSKLKPEMLAPGVKAKNFRPVETPKSPITFRMKIRSYLYLGKTFTIPTLKFVWNNKRLTLTLISTAMKVKTNQTSTKAGIMLLVTVLGFLGINVDPEFFSQQATLLVEGVISVIGAGTALWAIFKDDEKENA